MKFKVFCQHTRTPDFIFQSCCNKEAFCSEKAAQKALDKHIGESDLRRKGIIHEI